MLSILKQGYYYMPHYLVYTLYFAYYNLQLHTRSSTLFLFLTHRSRLIFIMDHDLLLVIISFNKIDNFMTKKSLILQHNVFCVFSFRRNVKFRRLELENMYKFILSFVSHNFLFSQTKKYLAAFINNQFVIQVGLK